jgi:hypothetical protein
MLAHGLAWQPPYMVWPFAHPWLAASVHNVVMSSEGADSVMHAVCSEPLTAVSRTNTNAFVNSLGRQLEWHWQQALMLWNVLGGCVPARNFLGGQWHACMLCYS